MPFKLGQIKRWWGWDWDPGEGISDMLVTELVNSGRFSVVERERLDEVLQEQNLAREGVVNAATAARIGRVLGVQLFVFGTVTQFSLDSKIIELPVVGKLAEWRARCGVNARLVNVETSEIMAAVTGQGAKSQSNVKLSERWGDLSGFAFGSSRFAEHILGKATTEAVKDVSEAIEENTAGLTPVVITPEVTPPVTPEVEAEVIEGLVAKVSDEEVIINVGSQKGIEVNDIFNVRRIIERITDPQTGKVILERKEKIAEIKISEVYELAAIGKITLLGVGKEIEVGDLVDLQK
jgi:curli biogenesis system outer membrane secretion channel CsgG